MGWRSKQPFIKSQSTQNVYWKKMSSAKCMRAVDFAYWWFFGWWYCSSQLQFNVDFLWLKHPIEHFCCTSQFFYIQSATKISARLERLKYVHTIGWDSKCACTYFWQFNREDIFVADYFFLIIMLPRTLNEISKGICCVDKFCP